MAVLAGNKHKLRFMDLSFSAIDSIKSEQILENCSRIDSNYLQTIASISNWTIIICRWFSFLVWSLFD